MLVYWWWWFCPNLSSSWKVIGGRDRTHDEWFKKADLSIVPHPLLLSHPAKLGPLRAVHLLRSSKNLTRSRSDRGQTTFPGQLVCQHEMSLWMSNHGSQETNCCCWCWCWWWCWCWRSERPPTTSTPSSSSVSQPRTNGHKSSRKKREKKVKLKSPSFLLLSFFGCLTSYTETFEWMKPT